MGCIYRREGIQLCNSIYNVKQVEFRHPQYKEYNLEIILCEVHFEITFEDIINEERGAYNKFSRESKHYQVMYKESKRQTEEGIGFFDHKEFHNNFYGKTSTAKREWEIIKKRRCRLEYCKNDLRLMRNLYTIKVFPKNNIDYTNYFFCSQKHWETIKLRIGIMKLTDSPDFKPITLDNFGCETT